MGKPTVRTALAVALALAVSLGESSRASAVTIGIGTYLYAEGFDTCAYVDSGTIDDWWLGTPWFFYGTYLGGSGGQEKGCVAMSTTTIQHAVTTGFALEPFWYGPQMPSSCTGLSFSHTISLNTTNAYNQGVAEAQSANTKAQTYSYGIADVIFYDLEAVGTSSTCIAAAQAFIDGWDYEINTQTNYWGSLYGSTCSSELSHFAAIDHPPFSIAPRDVNHDPTGVYGLLCLSDSLWNHDQRVHQLAAEVYKKYGTHGMYIDEDCADARLDTNRTSGFNINNCARY